MSDDETLKLIRFAVSDPGAFLPRERWPDTSGIGKWEYESIPAWGARAVAKALDGRLLPPVVDKREEFGEACCPPECLVPHEVCCSDSNARGHSHTHQRTIFVGPWREVSP